MTRRHISFTLPVPPELVYTETLLLQFRATLGGVEPTATDASGIGKNYRPERGDNEDRRHPRVHDPLGDDAFIRTARALSVLHHQDMVHAWVVHTAYNIKPGNPQALCRKLRIQPAYWCDYRNAGLRKLESILLGDVDAQWKMAYPANTREQVAEDALAD